MKPLVLRPLSPGADGQGAGTEAAARGMFKKQQGVPKALCLSPEGQSPGNASPSETPSREQPERRRLGDSRGPSSQGTPLATLSTSKLYAALTLVF